MLDTNCERYLADLVEMLAGALGDSLVGVYLHGSAVLGGFDTRRSDLDVLAVCRRGNPDDVRATVVERLTASAARCPAAGLEFSLVTEHAVRHPAACPPFETHVATTGGEPRIVDGAGRDGDPDLVLYFALLRAAGRVLDDGPPPATLFAPVPRELVLDRLRAELAWAVEHSPDEYAVLNACRAWRYAAEGTLVSKIDGGEWAAARCGPADRAVVAAALAAQRSVDGASVDPTEAVRFARQTAARLSAGHV